MSDSSSPEITEQFAAFARGEKVDADQLMPLVYDDFRALANKMLQHERPGSTLQPTAVVNEVYLKLVDQNRVDWKGRSHFFAVGATIMRRILVDRARRRLRKKRGGDWQKVELENVGTMSVSDDEDVLAVDEALEKLHALDPVQAKIVELRFFSGMTVAEVSEALGVSKRKIEYEWTMIRAWLRRELDRENTR